jgi:hypothetical protein
MRRCVYPGSLRTIAAPVSGINAEILGGERGGVVRCRVETGCIPTAGLMGACSCETVKQHINELLILSRMEEFSRAGD